MAHRQYLADRFFSESLFEILSELAIWLPMAAIAIVRPSGMEVPKQ